VFTTLFAVGVLIISAAAARIDLDPACVLYGILELVPFDTIDVFGLAVPRAFLTGLIVLAVVAAGLVTTWKLQVFTAFDADAARAAGVPVAAVTAGLLAATALATVAGFEAVGAVLAGDDARRACRRRPNCSSIGSSTWSRSRWRSPWRRHPRLSRCLAVEQRTRPA